jgi:competence protein ComEC
VEDIFINAYFSKEQNISLPDPGDIIIIGKKPREIRNRGNPNEFDYRRYLSLQKTYFSCYLEAGDWGKTGLPSVSGKLKILSLEIRDFLQQRIKKISHNYPDLKYDVMLAICTGDKSYLENDIKKAYSQAGAIHVMAVSGLHVGLIWAFMNYLSFFLRKRKAGRILQFILIISILWIYALVTGMSPSVVRSCTMFSLASLAGIFNRKSLVYNTLFISALIQLVVNPNIAFDVGFQFSYMAVLSILLFHKPLSKLIKSRHLITSKIIDLVNVSLAAQVLTFPLAIYYFHQFPVYFLLGNIFIIPLVTLLMILFFGSVIFLLIPALSDIMLLFALRITSFMNFIVQTINTLPNNVISSITIDRYQVFLLIYSFLALLMFYYYRKFSYLLTSLILWVLFLIAGINNHHEKHIPSLCIFNVERSTLVHLSLAETNALIHCEELDSESIEYAAGNYLTENYYQDPQVISFPELLLVNDFSNLSHLPGEENFLINPGGYRIAFISDLSFFRKYSCSNKLNVDILVFRGEKIPTLRSIRKVFKSIDTIVVTSEMPYYVPDLSIPDTARIIYHRVSEKGAYRQTLQ